VSTERKYEQQAGNIRYLCPACQQPAIQPITLHEHDYVCPVTQKIVKAAEVKAAPQLELKELK